jgi:hypothetical protein
MKGQADLTQSGKFRTITYRLPSDVTNIQLGTGAMSCCIEFEPGGFYDTMEFPPGKKQITFSYQVAAENRDLLLSKTVTLPTKEIDFMINDSSITATGDKIVYRPLPNAPLQRYVAKGLEANDTLTLKLAGLAGKPLNVSRITILSFGLLVVLFGLFAFRKIKKNNTATEKYSKESQNVQDKEAILQQILALDEAYETKQLPETEYQHKLEILKIKLESLV